MRFIRGKIKQVKASKVCSTFCVLFVSLYLVACSQSSGRGAPVISIKTESKHTQRQVARAVHPKPKPQTQVARQESKPVTRNLTKVSEQVHKEPAPKPIVSAQHGTNRWVWPTSGKIITRFKENGALNKGINIVNNKGTPIVAVQSGKVVYSGQGLRGYGQLLIIKHEGQFLSAYAHNEALLVKEGQHVKQGQVIAKMGQSDSDQVMLHFEIREKGKPIDPLRFLPADRS